MSMTRLKLIGFAVSLAAAACSSSQEKSDALDIVVADDESGLRGTTVVGDEEVVIETRIVVEPAEATDGTTHDEEFLLVTITGDDATPYADWRLGILSDKLTGTIAGRNFGQETSARRSDDDWTALAASPTGALLTEVSQRAGAAMARPDLAPVEFHLFTVADVGPYLQTLPAIFAGADALCGDGTCSVDETDGNCPEDCGCAAEDACGGVAPFGCYCTEDCAENGDCCVDACQTCGAGCPPCGENVPCEGSCTNVLNACDGKVDCLTGEDEAQCNTGACRPGQLACDSGGCIEFYQFCDGTANCPGGEDEVCECAYCDPD
jgi:hypothetical protein